jgi:ankyrin repeat protein
MSEATTNDYKHPMKLVKILLDNGADPHKSNDSDTCGSCASEYPLYTAIRSNNIELVVLLVKTGADINQKSYDLETGSSPLASAIFYRHPAVVAFLLESGAEVQTSFVLEIPVLAWAAINCPEIYKIVRSHTLGPPHMIDVPGILYASRNGPAFLSNYLHEAGELAETERRELLERALCTVVICHTETLTPLEALLDVGVNANVPSQMGTSPLASALQSGMYEAAEILLSRGADPNAPGVLQECTSDFDTLELVIDHGADAKKDAGNAFYTAIASRSLKCVALLIKSGADVNSRGYRF